MAMLRGQRDFQKLVAETTTRLEASTTLAAEFLSGCMRTNTADTGPRYAPRIVTELHFGGDEPGRQGQPEMLTNIRHMAWLAEGPQNRRHQAPFLDAFLA